MKLAKIRGGVFVRGYARFVRLARASDTRFIWCGFRIVSKEKKDEDNQDSRGSLPEQ